MDQSHRYSWGDSTLDLFLPLYPENVQHSAARSRTILRWRTVLRRPERDPDGSQRRCFRCWLRWRRMWDLGNQIRRRRSLLEKSILRRGNLGLPLLGSRSWSHSRSLRTVGIRSGGGGVSVGGKRSNKKEGTSFLGA